MAVHAGRALFEQGIGDRRGNAQRGVLVWVYDRGTSNLSTLYTDRTKATEQDNPLTTNGLGNLAIFADPGDYEAHVDSTGAILEFTVLPDWEDVVTGDEPEGGLPAHLVDAVDAHDASAISFTPSGSVAATDVQGAVVEVASDAASALSAGLATKQDTIAAGTYNEPPSTAEKVVYVSPNGDDANTGQHSGTGVKGAVKTLARAKTLMGTTTRGVIQMGIGDIDAGAGFSLSGYRCSMKGSGPGTVVKITAAQVGPAVDLLGWLHPGFEYVQEFSDFTIEGDNVAGSDHADAMTKPGMRTGLTAGLSVRNVTVRKTAGPGFDTSTTQCSTFTNVVVDTPVGAKANDVPYFYGKGDCNGNLFSHIGMRSSLSAADCGVSGVFLLEDNGVNPPVFNTLESPWVEFLHVPTNGSVFHLKGNNNTVRNFQAFDSSKEAGATGTCYFRLDPPAIQSYGANSIEGFIPGTTGGTTLDSGVELNQAGNRVVGTKGLNGGNVTIASGIGRSFVCLGGALAAATAAGWTDNSGLTTNELHDHVIGVTVLPAANIVKTDATSAITFKHTTAGVDATSLTINPFDLRLGGLSFSRLGRGSSGQVYFGYNLAFDNGADNRFEHDSTGVLAGVAFTTAGNVDFYAKTSAAAGTAATATMTLTSAGPLRIRAGTTSILGLSFYSDNYGIGMDATDLNLITSSGQGLRIRGNDITGTVWARFTATALTMTTRVDTMASASAGAGLRLPHGAAPSAPVNGDMWTTTAGLFVQINGVTKTVTLT